MKKGAKMNQPDLPPMRVIERRPLAVTPTTIAPLETESLHVWPQFFFKARGLMLPRRFPTLYLIDAVVGRQSQLASDHEIPMDTFYFDTTRLELAVESMSAGAANPAEWLASMNRLIDAVSSLRLNFGFTDTCQVGQRVTLKIRNAGPEPVLFEGALIGTAIENPPTLMAIPNEEGPLVAPAFRRA